MKNSNTDDRTRDHNLAPGSVCKSNKWFGRSFRILIFWLLSLVTVLLMMKVIFHFSAANSSASSGLSQGFCRRMIKAFLTLFPTLIPAESIPHMVDLIETPVRKMAHFSEYTVLGFLMINHVLFVGRMRRLQGKNTFSLRKMTGISIGICVLYAVSDEIHQYFVPGRACRILDVCIDSSGVVFGTILFSVIFWRLLDALFGKGYNEA